MLFSILLYISLCIFVLGTAWKITAWFTRCIGPASRDIPSSRRVSAALQGMRRTLFSRKIVVVAAAFFLDGILQRRILKESVLRWVMHMTLFAGFMLLLLMHALDEWITMRLFEGYSSTANPFFFLRDFLGVLVLVGLGIAGYRRFILKVPRLRTRTPDRIALLLLVIIMVSGLFLEGAKMLSHREYQQMVEDFADTDDSEELRALESYWVQEFGVASPDVSPPFPEEALSLGREVHEMSCAYCHAPSQWAFAGYGTNRALLPIAAFLERIHAVLIFWHIHILACFIGLAYVPFSKMFHILATPVGLAVSAVTDAEHSDPANIATRQAIELDACTQCGTCSLRCSQVGAFEALDNPYILPSERMFYLRRLGRSGRPDPAAFEALRQGAYICSNCDRCTVVCPAGINLRELWMSVREDLLQEESPEPVMLSPFSFLRGLRRPTLERTEDYGGPLLRARHAVAGNGAAGEPSSGKSEPLPVLGPQETAKDPLLQAEHFSHCFGCRTCTTVCPVVAAFEDPEDRLGLLPHQIMACLGLGLQDMAGRAGMLWDCVTCYQCEENCPQGVRITDIFYTLKNRVIQKDWDPQKRHTDTRDGNTGPQQPKDPRREV
jgi:heterodisulfide reductase subunit C/nitrate reductase gamma subunit